MSAIEMQPTTSSSLNSGHLERSRDRLLGMFRLSPTLKIPEDDPMLENFEACAMKARSVAEKKLSLFRSMPEITGFFCPMADPNRIITTWKDVTKYSHALAEYKEVDSILEFIDAVRIVSDIPFAKQARQCYVLPREEREEIIFDEALIRREQYRGKIERIIGLETLGSNRFTPVSALLTQENVTIFKPVGSRF